MPTQSSSVLSAFSFSHLCISGAEFCSSFAAVGLFELCVVEDVCLVRPDHLCIRRRCTKKIEATAIRRWDGTQQVGGVIASQLSARKWMAQCFIHRRNCNRTLLVKSRNFLYSTIFTLLPCSVSRGLEESGKQAFAPAGRLNFGMNSTISVYHSTNHYLMSHEGDFQELRHEYRAYEEITISSLSEAMFYVKETELTSANVSRDYTVYGPLPFFCVKVNLHNQH